MPTRACWAGCRPGLTLADHEGDEEEPGDLEPGERHGGGAEPGGERQGHRGRRGADDPQPEGGGRAQAVASERRERPAREPGRAPDGKHPAGGRPAGVELSSQEHHHQRVEDVHRQVPRHAHRREPAQGTVAGDHLDAREDARAGAGRRARGRGSDRIDARSAAARAKPAASTHSASTAPTRPIQPSAECRADQEAERPDERQVRLALDEVGVADEPCRRAECRRVDEDAAGGHPHAGGEDKRDRQVAGRRTEGDDHRQHRGCDRLEGGRPHHHRLAAAAVAELARVQAEREIRDRRDQEGRARERPRAARVEHDPGQDDQAEPARHRVHQLRDEEPAAVARPEEDASHSQTGGPERSRSVVPRPASFARSRTCLAAVTSSSARPTGSRPPGRRPPGGPDGGR